MFVRTIEVHWKTVRWPLAIVAVLAFAAPLVWAVPRRSILTELPADVAARYWLTGTASDEASGVFPFLAVAVGVLVALGVWYWDHREDHVWALSLPVTRARYVLVKFAAGAVLLAVVAAAFFSGALVVSLTLDLPDWLHAYPGRLAFKFLLATLMVYALIFALAAGTIPTTLKTLTVIAVLALVIPVLPLLFDAAIGEVALRAAEIVGRVLYEWPGPFAVLGGDWALIGV